MEEMYEHCVYICTKRTLYSIVYTRVYRPDRNPKSLAGGGDFRRPLVAKNLKIYETQYVYYFFFHLRKSHRTADDDPAPDRLHAYGIRNPISAPSK